MVLCIVTAAFSLQGSAMRHATFAQAKSNGETCQIYGKLEKDTVNMQRKMTLVTMKLREEKTGEEIGLLWDRPEEPVAANLANASDVRAIGTYDSSKGVFRVNQLYTKCPSKYQTEGLNLGKDGKAPAPEKSQGPSDG